MDHWKSRFFTKESYLKNRVIGTKPKRQLAPLLSKHAKKSAAMKITVTREIFWTPAPTRQFLPAMVS